MQIKVPLPLVRAADRFGGHMNVTLWQRGRLELRIVDVWVGIFGVLNLAWGFYLGGWLGALQYFLVYVLLCMVGLWFLR